MSDNQNTNEGTVTTESLMLQVQSELRKADRDAAKAKLKEIAKKRNDAMKTVRLLDLEAQKVVEDYNAGIV